MTNNSCCASPHRRQHRFCIMNETKCRQSVQSVECLSVREDYDKELLLFSLSPSRVTRNKRKREWKSRHAREGRGSARAKVRNFLSARPRFARIHQSDESWTKRKSLRPVNMYWGKNRQSGKQMDPYGVRPTMGMYGLIKVNNNVHSF